MKKTKQIPEPLSDWLVRQPMQPFLLTLLALCDVAGLYIVGQDQQVIYRGQGAKQLSGLKAADITGKLCLQEYAITEDSDHKKQLIKSFKVDGQTIELNKFAQVLYD